MSKTILNPESFDKMFKSLLSQILKKVSDQCTQNKTLTVSFPKIWNDLRNEKRLSDSLKKTVNMIKKINFLKYKSLHCKKNIKTDE